MSRFTFPVKYSNQDFDEISNRAQQLADEGRAAGLIQPGFGYTKETFEQAQAEYRAAYWVWLNGPPDFSATAPCWCGDASH